MDRQQQSASGGKKNSRTPGRELIEKTGRKVGRSVFVVETERLSTMRKVIAETAAGEYARDSRITVICNNRRGKYYQSLPSVSEVVTYPARGIFAKIAAAAKLLLLTGKPDLIVSVLNGERHFRKSKLLFWLLKARRRLIFDGHLDSFLLDSSNRKRLFSKSRKNMTPPRRIDVLIFETDAIEIVREVIRKTQDSHVIPSAQITVFCRESSVEALKSCPRVKKIAAYADHSPVSWFKQALRTISRKNTVIVGVLNGRKRFFLSKLLFCLCRNRHRLVFNGSLDCCFWNRHTYGQIISQGLKTGVNSPFADNPRKVLVLETAEPETMKKLISRAAEPKVNPNARITLFCGETRLGDFDNLPGIEKIVTYSDNSLKAKLSVTARIIFSYPDSVAARFNGGKDFRPMKMLFWLVRTPNRIVFNETLDCFYLNRKTAAMFIFGNNRNLVDSLLVTLIRKLVKLILFLPRFAYLLIWRGTTLLHFKLKH